MKTVKIESAGKKLFQLSSRQRTVSIDNSSLCRSYSKFRCRGNKQGYKNSNILAISSGIQLVFLHNTVLRPMLLEFFTSLYKSFEKWKSVGLALFLVNLFQKFSKLT